MAEQVTPPDPTVQQFVAKLEAFAAGLSERERELLRIALGIDLPAPQGHVRTHLARL